MLIFENINTNNEKTTQKHIRINNNQLLILNQIQTAYKTQTSQHITLNDLINMSINLLIKETKKEIVNKNEFQAIEYLKELNKMEL